LVELYSKDKISIRDDEWKPVIDAIKYLQEGGYLARLTTKILETVEKIFKYQFTILQEMVDNL
jgi:hypothetical protein